MVLIPMKEQGKTKEAAKRLGGRHDI